MKNVHHLQGIKLRMHAPHECPHNLFFKTQDATQKLTQARKQLWVEFLAGRWPLCVILEQKEHLVQFHPVSSQSAKQPLAEGQPYCDRRRRVPP
jgi:hypothetical protein